ncbi:S8 family peptidase [Clostridiisalibacter paucivorans]|uniref:S8 family peptidase n=1 Tax=Clostridiisalibacter paucivorans TaxID=408753 RepID=UPI00068691BB|nr:S8 family peptidase [Clostridiisalibacter paucivorans]
MESGLSNLYVNKTGESFDYIPANGGGGTENSPPRISRLSHAERLENDLRRAWDLAEESQEDVGVVSVSSRHGVYLEIKGQAGYDLITKSLEHVGQHVRICNIKTEEDSENKKIVSSTVYVPENKRDFFIKKINKYKETENAEKVIGTIESINLAYVDALWMSDKSKMPTTVPQWCEVWLMYETKEDIEEIQAEFFKICEEKSIEYKNQRIIFPERLVLAVKANKQQLSELQWLSSRIAEFRIIVTPAGFFEDLSEWEQRDFVKDLAERLDISARSNTSVCILDTGVNNGHGLLAPLLSDEDMHSVDLDKGVYDRNKHGTMMAGIAAYYTLEDKLESSDPVIINHFLESVKLFDKEDDNEKDLYGYVTENAINLAQIQNPETNRSICMAVTAKSNAIENDGRPSSWSGAIDSVISGANDIGSSDVGRKLMFVSAGNTHMSEIKESGDVLTAVRNHTIEDPGQSWNAITVGAYTEKYQIPEEYSDNYQPVVEPGNFSPFTSSSIMWREKWPIKPDIVLEGGNLVYDEATDFYSDLPDLQLLTTSKDFQTGKSFDVISMTSSATAQAAWIGANIQHQYPELWPETVRALIIHSAEWTDAMKKATFENSVPKRSDYRNLMRICGYGVPNLSKAIWSASNRVNLIIEDEIQPFQKKGSGNPTSKEMHIHKIPWPDDVLLGLEDETVRMRVTLSYFVEPGPGEIGWKDKYRYPSCGLQFDVNNSTEDNENFLKRINKAIRDDEEDRGDVKNDSNRWVIGTSNRNVGSIHSDIWEGTASDLSQSNKIAVYPITGWWKSRTNLKKFNSKIRYSLVVSIEAPEVEIDLYNVIKNKIETEINVENRTTVTTEITY